MKLDDETFDWFLKELPTDNRENLRLEVLVHFLDKDGNRIKPSCNRTLIPLQVKEINQTERVMLPMFLLNAVISMLKRCEVLHRLVRDPKRVSRLADMGSSNHDKLLELAAFPIQDCIEIQELQ